MSCVVCRLLVVFFCIVFLFAIEIVVCWLMELIEGISVVSLYL